MRIRGFININYTGPEEVQVTAAARVGSEGEVAAVGFNPASQGKYDDWMLYEPIVAVDPTTHNFAWQGPAYSSRMIDVKASRKLDELGQTLWMYVGSGAGVSAEEDYGIAWNLSILLMLP